MSEGARAQARYLARLEAQGIVRREFLVPLSIVEQLDELRTREGLSSRSEALVAALRTVKMENVSAA